MSCDHSAVAVSRRNSACRSQIKAMLRPSHWRGLQYCAKVYVKEMLKCISVFQHCRFSQDREGGERNSGSGASSHHSCLWLIRFQHSKQCDASFPAPSTFKRSDLPHRKDIKTQAYWLDESLYSLKPPCCGGGSVRHYSTTCLHRTATAAGLTSLRLFGVSPSDWPSAAAFSRPPRSPARSPRP